MSNPKRHHYNPQFILRNFSDDGEHIWSYNKAEGIDRRRIERVFAFKHLYTRKTIDPTNKASQSEKPKTFEQSIRKDYGYEKLIGELETKAAPIVDRVIDHAKKRQCPKLSTEQSATLKEFMFLAARRTPEAQARVRATSGTDDPDLFYKVVKTLADREDFPLPGKKQLYEDLRVAMIEDLTMSNASATFAAGVAPKMQKQIANFGHETGIRVLLCAHQRRFIVGSSGFAIATLRTATAFSRISVFPLAADVAVVPTDRPWREELSLLENWHVRAINIAIAEQSHTIAGLTEADVCKYVQYVR